MHNVALDQFGNTIAIIKKFITLQQLLSTFWQIQTNIDIASELRRSSTST